VNTVLARHLANHDIDGWTIKTYGMAADGGRPRAELTMAARRRAATTLPPRPDRVGAYGVGFLIVHEAADACFALVDWWVHPDQLHQRVFSAALERPAALEPLHTPVIGCVSALAVIAHERQSWLRHVLTNPTGPNIDAYLADTVPS
jgi:hypothetical protein